MTAEHSADIARRVPAASLFLVEEANHSVHLEKPAEVLARIREHLSS